VLPIRNARASSAAESINGYGEVDSAIETRKALSLAKKIEILVD